MKAPASIFWTVLQSQDQPTPAGTMRTAILIHPEAAHRAHHYLLAAFAGQKTIVGEILSARRSGGSDDRMTISPAT